MLMRVAVAFLGLCGMLAVSQTLQAQRVSRDFGTSEWPQALKMADYILSLQNSAGAISSLPGGAGANLDSDMEYALIGLGAAYHASGQAKYLTGFENGIKWLAAREEMTDPFWKGSFWYVYSVNPPYAHIPTSPGPGVTDVRGVDATSTLFVYLLYLDKAITGSTALVNQYSANATAALDFVINHNTDTDGLSWSSWQLISGTWQLYKFKYAADQGDVWLGMQAGNLLYNASKYGPVASNLLSKVPGLMYSTLKKRYGQGLDEAGGLCTSFCGFCGIFPNGYIPWMWGNSAPQDDLAENWLDTRVQADGSITAKSGAPAYSLSVAILGMADAALGEPEPLKSFQYLTKSPVPYDSVTGGVHDIKTSTSDEPVNVAAFSLIGLVGFVPY